MPRYVAIIPRPTSCDGDECALIVGTTVYEADREPTKTGLLDATGTPLFRVEDKAPFGFYVGGGHGG
jgi:hypothetical protein